MKIKSLNAMKIQISETMIEKLYSNYKAHLCDIVETKPQSRPL